MADIVKTKNVLSLEAEFVDGDTRTINLDDPVANLSASSIQSVGSYVKTNSILVGDKEGAAFNKFKSAKVTTGTTTYLDLD